MRKTGDVAAVPQRAEPLVLLIPCAQVGTSQPPSSPATHTALLRLCWQGLASPGGTIHCMTHGKLLDENCELRLWQGLQCQLLVNMLQFVFIMVEARNNFKMEIVIICLQKGTFSFCTGPCYPCLNTSILFSLKQTRKKIPERYKSKGVLKTSCLALCFWLFLWAEVFNSVFYLDYKLICIKNIPPFACHSCFLQSCSSCC